VNFVQMLSKVRPQARIRDADGADVDESLCDRRHGLSKEALSKVPLGSSVEDAAQEPLAVLR
jgi:hypothetical protein